MRARRARRARRAEGEDNEEDESNKRRKVMVGLNEVHAALLTDKRDTLAAHVLAAMAVLR